MEEDTAGVSEVMVSMSKIAPGAVTVPASLYGFILEGCSGLFHPSSLPDWIHRPSFRLSGPVRGLRLTDRCYGHSDTPPQDKSAPGRCLSRELSNLRGENESSLDQGPVSRVIAVIAGPLHEYTHVPCSPYPVHGFSCLQPVLESQGLPLGLRESGGTLATMAAMAGV